MRTAFPAVADRASGRAVPVHRARYRRQGHLLALGAAAGTAAEISGRSDRATIGVGSPVLEMRNWAMGRPRAPRRNLGTRDLANMGARAAQNPEPRHQVAVTRLDVHHTVGGSHTERPIKGSDRSRSARQRPAEGDSAVTTTNTLEAAPSTSSTTWTAHGPRLTVARRCS